MVYSVSQTLRGLVEFVNRQKISKDDIVMIHHDEHNDEWILIYFEK